MNKSVGFILLLLMFTNTMNAELANGKIEEFFIKNGIEERKIRIYYPNNNSVDDDTTFIIMNDGEELFLERDSWRGRTWRIDKSCLLYTSPSPRDAESSRMPSSA